MSYVRGDEQLRSACLSNASVCLTKGHGYIQTVTVLDGDEIYEACPLCLKLNNEVLDVRIEDAEDTTDDAETEISFWERMGRLQ